MASGIRKYKKIMVLIGSLILISIGIILLFSMLGVGLTIAGIIVFLYAISPALSVINFVWKTVEKGFEYIRKGHSNLEQISQSVTEQKTRRFRLLNKRVFLKLRDHSLIFPDEGDPVDLFKLNYDLTQLKEDPSYPEASEYLEKDLQASTIRPAQLESLVNKFTKFD